MSENTTYNHGQHLDEIHQSHRNWLENLSFMKAELRFYGHQVELVSGWQAIDGSQVEQLQNKIILLNEQIDQLAQRIRRDDQKLTVFADEHPELVSGSLFFNQSKLTDNLIIQQKIYSDFKKDFYLAIHEKKTA